MKPRHHLYLDDDLTGQLNALAAKPGSSKSAIVADALRAYLARRASREIDDVLKAKFDRITGDIGKVRRDLEVLLESFALFVHHQLTVTAPLSEGDAAARAIGRDRFEAFVSEVGRQIGRGKRTLSAPASIGDER